MTRLVPPQPELKPDACRVPHRKNAIEWVMYVVLLPLVPIAWIAARVRRR